ncbi:hypothetical protein PR048_014049 [Dryococelus australis]|uniref:Uncharacterized protein n=1 Tax=Dryococelus australis TaxID=614101 RepID=A0ABQ9HU13_9NEOP|nr:hypothetical protein PR048_014049 [Dryococelus australis]
MPKLKCMHQLAEEKDGYEEDFAVDLVEEDWGSGGYQLEILASSSKHSSLSQFILTLRSFSLIKSVVRHMGHTWAIWPVMGRVWLVIGATEGLAMVPGACQLLANCLPKGDDLLVRLLASDLDEPSSIPSGITPGYSHVGIVANDAAGRRVLSQGSPVSPGLAFWRCSPHFTPIGSRISLCCKPPKTLDSITLTAAETIISWLPVAKKASCRLAIVRARDPKIQKIRRFSVFFIYALNSVFRHCGLRFRVFTVRFRKTFVKFMPASTPPPPTTYAETYPRAPEVLPPPSGDTTAPKFVTMLRNIWKYRLEMARAAPFMSAHVVVDWPCEAARANRDSNGLVEELANCTDNETFRYWYQFLRTLFPVLRDLTRAQRKGNWDLSISALMEIYAQFQAGHFVVKNAQRKCSCVAMDQALEQNYNKPAIGHGGIIVVTRKKEAVTNTLYITSFQKNITAADEQRVRRIMNFMEAQGNPSNYKSSKWGKKLQNITTKQKIDHPKSIHLLNYKQIGEKAHSLFRKERFEEKSLGVVDPIKKLKNHSENIRNGIIEENLSLTSHHEEAGERILTHISHMTLTSNCTISLPRDLENIGLQELWVAFGVGRTLPYIPLHSLVTENRVSRTVLMSLPVIHYLTGCDTTSKVSTIIAVWKTAESYAADLLFDFGKEPLTEDMEKRRLSGLTLRVSTSRRTPQLDVKRSIRTLETREIRTKRFKEQEFRLTYSEALLVSARNGITVLHTVTYCSISHSTCKYTETKLSPLVANASWDCIVTPSSVLRDTLQLARRLTSMLAALTADSLAAVCVCLLGGGGKGRRWLEREASQRRPTRESAMAYPTTIPKSLFSLFLCVSKKFKSKYDIAYIKVNYATIELKRLLIHRLPINQSLLSLVCTAREKAREMENNTVTLKKKRIQPPPWAFSRQNLSYNLSLPD